MKKIDKVEECQRRGGGGGGRGQPTYSLKKPHSPAVSLHLALIPVFRGLRSAGKDKRGKYIDKSSAECETRRGGGGGEDDEEEAALRRR